MENKLNLENKIDFELLNFFEIRKDILNLEKEKVIFLFKEAFKVDKLFALKILFYIRDPRGGIGNREGFRYLLNYLGKNEPEIVFNNLTLIPYYGRWDDLYALFETPLEDEVIRLFRRQLKEDIESKHPSLLAKWMKSENATSKESKKLAKITIGKIGLNSRAYRKTLSYLRKKIKITETNICKKEFEKLDYENIPKGSLKKYSGLFLKEDYIAYVDYLNTRNDLAFTGEEEFLTEKELMSAVLNNERYNLIKL